MSEYTNKEEEAIGKARKILEKAGMYIEGDDEMPDEDGLERWCIHPSKEN